MKKIYHAIINQKKGGVAILKLDKVNFRSRKITRDRKGYHITIKASIHQEDIATLNLYEQTTNLQNM